MTPMFNPSSAPAQLSPTVPVRWFAPSLVRCRWSVRPESCVCYDANGHRAGTRPKLKISRPRSSEASAQEGPSSAAHRRSGHGSAATGCSDIDHVPIVLLRRDRGAAGSGPFGSPRIGESGFWGSGRYPLASSQMGLGGLPHTLTGGSGLAAGPLMIMPVYSNREPWQGQSQVRARLFQSTMQPM